MKPIQKVGIIGLGALGSFHAKIISDGIGRENCCVLADAERIARYKRDGNYFNGELYDYNYQDAALLKDPLDLIIFGCKFGGLTDCIETVRHLVGPDTVLLSMLNGISSEDILEAEFGEGHVVWCYVTKMAAKKHGNRAQIDKTGELVYGMPAGKDRAPLERLKAFFGRFDYAYTYTDDIVTEQWMKLMNNVGTNQSTMVYDCGFGGIQQPGEIRDTLIGAMEEVRKVAAAEGIDITEKMLTDTLATLDALPPDGETSMRQDRTAKRKSEVELFAGTIRRLAKKHGIEVPINDRLYQRVMEIEAEY